MIIIIIFFIELFVGEVCGSCVALPPSLTTLWLNALTTPLTLTHSLSLITLSLTIDCPLSFLYFLLWRGTAHMHRPGFSFLGFLVCF